MSKPDLLECTKEELTELLKQSGEKTFRAKQVWKWLYDGISDFQNMTDLPEALREKLANLYQIGGAAVAGCQTSAIDGTRKYLFQLNDGHFVESVLMQYEYGLSACVSTQVGCRMGCDFCASAQLGLVRNLTVGEMLSQVLLMGSDAGSRVSHVVLMGIGEPFDNYEHVLRFLRRMNLEDTLGISFRRMTVSTCGLVPQILAFSEEGIPVNLSVSLHASNDTVRMKTMPIARKWPMEELLEACWIYVGKTGRRITFEYALIAGVNDTDEQAEELAKRLAGKLCHVNLIPVNTILGGGYDKSNRERIKRFQDRLTKYGIAATVRRELGSDIAAACGQLRRTRMSEEDQDVRSQE